MCSLSLFTIPTSLFFKNTTRNIWNKEAFLADLYFVPTQHTHCPDHDVQKVCHSHHIFCCSKINYVTCIFLCRRQTKRLNSEVCWLSYSFLVNSRLFWFYNFSQVTQQDREQGIEREQEADEYSMRDPIDQSYWDVSVANSVLSGEYMLAAIRMPLCGSWRWDRDGTYSASQGKDNTGARKGKQTSSLSSMFFPSGRTEVTAM